MAAKYIPFELYCDGQLCPGVAELSYIAEGILQCRIAPHAQQLQPRSERSEWVVLPHSSIEPSAQSASQFCSKELRLDIT